ncbi:MAG: hypothetical protein IJX85_01070 [Lachnospiraceae bacterium]|nr:hypothetical protein [Lachnospiraceae bacterium]
MQKKSIVGNIIGVVIITALIALFLVSQAGYLFDSTPIDIVEHIEAEGAPVKGEYVSVEVDAVVEHFAETDHRINGIIPMGTDNHYLLWLTDDSFIALTANGKELCNKLSDIKNQTQLYVMGNTDYLSDPVKIEGKVATMDSEIEDYYRDALDYWGIYSSDGLQIYYVTIDETDSKLSNWLMVGFLVLIDIIAIAVLVKDVKDNKELKAQEAARALNAANMLNQNMDNQF